MFYWLRTLLKGWSWFAAGGVLITGLVALLALTQAQALTIADAIRYSVVALLVVFLSVFIGFMASREQVERDRKQAEMITGGDNFCYITIDRHDLKHGLMHLHLWVKSTGPLLNVTFHISPADSESGHQDGRYLYLNDPAVIKSGGGPAGGAVDILHKGSRAIINVLWMYEVLKWRVQFTARNGAWTQWIDLTRLDEGFRETLKVEHADGRSLLPPEDTK